MKKEHFVESNNEGQSYEFKFENTHLVGKRFIKPEEWGPFNKVGELTKAGREFVEAITNNQEAVYWSEEYPDSRT